MSRLFTMFEHWPRWAIIVTSLLMLPVLGIIDVVTGFELSFSVFYVAPVSMAAWHLGLRPALLISVLSAVIWLEADLYSGHVYSSAPIPYWNGLVRLAFYVIIAVLFATLRREHEHVRTLALTDALTQVPNSRAFRLHAEAELSRSSRSRSPLTVAYLDVDNFKAVNDLLGHSVGDELLQTVASTIRHGLRKTDVVARLGGDELALLLPQTGAEPAREILERLRAGLLAAVGSRGWPVTFSIGAVTFLVPPGSVDEMLRRADAVMYGVKRTTKDAVRLETAAA
jgi:diguanylate cyclase (GGDEF)-like protein